MTRAEDRARRIAADAARRKRADRELSRMVRQDQLEQRALAEFVPTPRPTLLARTVQRVLGPPAVDNPVHGHRARMLEQLNEALDHGKAPAPADPDGTQPDRNG